MTSKTVTLKELPNAKRTILNSASLKYAGAIDETQCATLLGFRTNALTAPACVRSVMKAIASDGDAKLDTYPITKNVVGIKLVKKGGCHNA